MTRNEVTFRIATLARRAGELGPHDPALQVLLTEMEALSRILPAGFEPDLEDKAAEALFDNMPV